MPAATRFFLPPRPPNMPSTAPAPGTLDRTLVAAPDRHRPSIAAPLAISIDLSTSSLSPATTFIRKSAGTPLAAFCGVKQPDSMASEFSNSRGLPRPYSDQPCVSPSTTAMVPRLSSHLASAISASFAIAGTGAVSASARALAVSIDAVFIWFSPLFPSEVHLAPRARAVPVTMPVKDMTRAVRKQAGRSSACFHNVRPIRDR